MDRTRRSDPATATAHATWDGCWRDDGGRRAWQTPDPDVVGAVPLLKERGARRILDLGCGVGRHLLMLASEGFRCFGLDRSEAGIAFSRRCAEESNLAVDLQVGAMTALPYADGAFDYVLSFNVIYHGDGTVVSQAIAEIRRVLAPGGLYQGTMLSKRNGHYRRGVEVAPDTFVEEAGEVDKHHPHFYCNAGELVALFGGFELLSLRDRPHSAPDGWHWHMLAENREWP